MGLQSALRPWSLSGVRAAVPVSRRAVPASTAVPAGTVGPGSPAAAPAGVPSAPTAHLDAIRPGATATICGFSDNVDPVLAQRLQDLGFSPGAEVSCLRVAPLGCPLMLRVGNADLCLRKQQARSIRITVDQP